MMVFNGVARKSVKKNYCDVFVFNCALTTNVANKENERIN